MRDNEYIPYEEEETQYDNTEPTRKKEKTSTSKPKKEAKSVVCNFYKIT